MCVVVLLHLSLNLYRWFWVSDGVHDFCTATKMGSSNNILEWDFCPFLQIHEGMLLPLLICVNIFLNLYKSRSYNVLIFSLNYFNMLALYCWVEKRAIAYVRPRECHFLCCCLLNCYLVSSLKRQENWLLCMCLFNYCFFCKCHCWNLLCNRLMARVSTLKELRFLEDLMQAEFIYL
jgi:hypothetical protein